MVENHMAQLMPTSNAPTRGENKNVAAIPISAQNAILTAGTNCFNPNGGSSDTNMAVAPYAGSASSFATGFSRSERKDCITQATNTAVTRTTQMEFWQKNKASGASQRASNEVCSANRRMLVPLILQRTTHTTHTIAAHVTKT